jgi:hypothetical protein
VLFAVICISSAGAAVLRYWAVCSTAGMHGRRIALVIHGSGTCRVVLALSCPASLPCSVCRYDLLDVCAPHVGHSTTRCMWLLCLEPPSICTCLWWGPLLGAASALLVVMLRPHPMLLHKCSTLRLQCRVCSVLVLHYGRQPAAVETNLALAVCLACLKLASLDTICAACPCLPLPACFLQLCTLLLAPACPVLLRLYAHHEQQYYFETIFPRIPKKVEDDIQAGLRSRGLPTKGRGNGGCGGADRRGGDDGNRRPASVKASLSVAFGQRAPNRAGTKDTARFKAAEAAVGAGGARGGSSRSRSRSREAPRRGGGATPERQPQRERREYDYDSRDRQREGDSR